MCRSGGWWVCVQGTQAMPGHSEHFINSSYYYYHHCNYWRGGKSGWNVMGQQNGGFKKITWSSCWPSGWDSGLSLPWPGFSLWLGTEIPVLQAVKHG